MCSDSGRIVNNTLLLYIRQILVLAIGLFTTRLTLQVLGVSDFGVYAAVAGFTTLLSIFTASLSNGSQRFFTFDLGSGDYDHLNRVYITSVNIHLVLALILIVIGETVGVWFLVFQMTLPEERHTIAFWVFQIALVNCALKLSNTPNNAIINAHERMGIVAVVSIVESVLRLLSVILLFFISWDKLLVYALAILGIEVVKRGIFWSYCRRHYQETKYRFIWDKELMKSMLHLSGWMGLSSLAVTGFIQGVTLLLNVFFGPAMNAAYSVAMQAYSGIRAFCSNFQVATNPQIVKLYASGELEKMHKLVFSVCKLSFFLIFLLSLPFLINVEFILKLWLGNVPEHSAIFFVLLIIYAYIDVFAYPLDIAASANGNLRKYSIVVSIAVISSLPIAYIAYVMGAIPESIYFIAILISWMCLFLRVSLLSTLIKIQGIMFFKKVIVRGGLVALTSLVIPLLFKMIVDVNFVTVIISFIITYSSVAMIILRLGLEADEKVILMNSYNSIKNKFH